MKRFIGYFVVWGYLQYTMLRYTYPLWIAIIVLSILLIIK